MKVPEPIIRFLKWFHNMIETNLLAVELSALLVILIACVLCFFAGYNDCRRMTSAQEPDRIRELEIRTVYVYTNLYPSAESMKVDLLYDDTNRWHSIESTLTKEDVNADK